jgi:thiamine pyrophosphokinase
MTLWIVSEMTGRLDSILSIIQSLYVYPQLKIFLIGSENLTFILPKHIDNKIVLESIYMGESIGLASFEGPARVTTTGLKWNLSNVYEGFLFY